MATVQFIELNGKRHDLEPSQIKTEKHCDQCGLFIPADHVVFANLQLMKPYVAPRQAVADVHVACLDTWLLAKATQYQREQMS